MKSKYYFVGLAIFTVLLLSDNVYACSCAGGGEPSCETFGRSGAVFVGTVTGVKTAPLPHSQEEVDKLRRAEDKGEWTAARTFKFSVELSFLGVDGTEVELGTGYGGGDCGYDFVPGKRYLVYAYRSKNNRLLRNSSKGPLFFDVLRVSFRYLLVEDEQGYSVVNNRPSKSTAETQRDLGPQPNVALALSHDISNAERSHSHRGFSPVTTYPGDKRTNRFNGFGSQRSRETVETVRNRFLEA